MGIGRIDRVDPDRLHETRDDAARLAAPAAAGPTIRTHRAAEGIASLAPRRHRRMIRNVPWTGTATDTPTLHDHAGRWGQ